ncbi:hypothetical protein DLAC_09538 [Tieghemostelium lacteum]|uniref:Peptidase C39-like domain-containing protein n=1 Tax=Tieghemostelium lacteum TaxID=361077 RepID=A0A151Z6K1_TIELA|nr:hypothetical protein DLAC_09538 [Tieghemostelium lacteum]|eukprot:KYQ89582.1 hypothetical protein DLAC_09538 [Tieghemostelium lacteum]
MQITSSLFITLFTLLVIIQCSYGTPSEYLIQGVPYQRQVTKYNCGDASLQMVFGYYNRSVNQKEIDDVARTTTKEGTLSYDIVRAAQFSILSSSQGDVKPKHEDSHGYKTNPFGLSAIGYSSDEFWIDGIKQLVSQDVPVIVLMAYALNDRGGHFRVVIGYDDITETVVTLDPWDRNNQPTLFNISYTDFEIMWNYTEPGSPRGQPFFGAAIWDLTPVVSHYNVGNQSFITSEITYQNYFPLPRNVNTTLPTALTQLTSIHLSQGIHLLNNADQQSSILSLNVQDGDTLTAKWVVECSMEPCVGTYEIQYQYLITGQVPETYDTHNHNYPLYQYQDIIGKNYTASF